VRPFHCRSLATSETYHDNRRLDQIDIDPWLLKHVDIVELEPVEIELNGAPGVGLQQRREIVGKLLLGEIVYFMLEVLTGTTNRAGVGLDSLGLLPLELEMLQMLVVIALEFSLD